MILLLLSCCATPFCVAAARGRLVINCLLLPVVCWVLAPQTEFQQHSQRRDSLGQQHSLRCRPANTSQLRKPLDHAWQPAYTACAVHRQVQALQVCTMLLPAVN